MIGDADLLNPAARYRRLLVTAVLLVVLLAPAYHQITGHITGTGWIRVGGALIMTGLALWFMNFTNAATRHVPWLGLALMLALGIALFVLGGDSWLGPLAVAAAMCGRFGSTPRPAVLAAVICAATGIAVAAAGHYNFGNTVSAVVIPPLTGLFAYSASVRAETLESLRRTRAELARAAVAEERLRIARDLHDLLGHSLSLITLKAELAGRLMSADPDRAAREVAELESVARQSLSDVREAVAGFRQPDLSGELAAARQLLDAAGITSQITSNDAGDFAQEVDAALAWAVREGTTNVVRHSRATHVAIRVSRSQAAAIVEISDNGPATPDETVAAAGLDPLTAGPAARAAVSRARPSFAGSGLAGLAERVRRLGGELAAGSIEPQGFRLRVVVPLSQQA
jgi:two-component system sensor histidine kinase DesK